MPVTFPGHQGLIIGAKLKWPTRVDGTALCVGAATPDLAYPLTSWLAVQSHTLTGVIVWGLPVTIIAAAILRWRAAAGIFAHLPDCGPLRLRSYRVLGDRSPRSLETVVSAFVGVASHAFIDSFAHTNRWGANALNLNDVVLTIPIRGPFTGADVIQYLGHSVGSLAFVIAIVFMASTGKLAAWYGSDAVAKARQCHITTWQRTTFWLVTVAPPVVVALAAPHLDRSRLFATITALFVSLLTAGTLVGQSAEPNKPADPSKPE